MHCIMNMKGEISMHAKTKWLVLGSVVNWFNFDKAINLFGCQEQCSESGTDPGYHSRFIKVGNVCICSCWNNSGKRASSDIQTGDDRFYSSIKMWSPEKRRDHPWVEDLINRGYTSIEKNCGLQCIISTVSFTIPDVV